MNSISSSATLLCRLAQPAKRLGHACASLVAPHIQPIAPSSRRPVADRATATGFAGWQSYAHTSDTSQILPRSWGLAVRELLLAARPKFTGIYVGNGLRFAEIRLSRLKKHTHTHTSDTHARLPTMQRIRLRSPRRWALFVCWGSVIMIADLRIRMRVGRCGSWLPLADFWGVGGLQPRVARPKSTESYCFQGGVGVHSAS